MQPTNRFHKIEVQKLKERYDAEPATFPFEAPVRRETYEEYENLVKNHFGQKFIESCSNSKTELTRSQFEEKYEPLHRSRIWKALCKEYCGQTGDPLAKSDRFLELAHLAYFLWHDPGQIYL